jgi:hypothetical protein
MLALFVALGLCVGSIGVSLAMPGGRSQLGGAVTDAARAPFIALVRKDARALCSAFTPSAARYLGSQQFSGASCEVRAQEGFDETKTVSGRRALVWAQKLRVTAVRWHDGNASAVVIYDKRRLRLSFRLVAGRWRIATTPVFVAVVRCIYRAPATECVTGARVAALWFLAPLPYELPGIPVPAKVRPAGGKELHDFKVGARVVANAGCLACHLIGSDGNAGPGPALTHLASHLNRRQIEHVIRHPYAPMPSFANLPRGKFKAMVRFLLLLR